MKKKINAVAMIMTLCFGINHLPASETFPLTWQKEPGYRVNITPKHVLAPDVQKMTDSLYRMYYTVTGEGVGSAVSTDGFAWTVEDSLRILSKRHHADYQEGDPGFDIGHPWLVKLPDGRWRMYLQTNSGIGTPLQIISAVSADEYNFSLEDGVRVPIGEHTGPPALSFAGHGRAMRHVDGSWIMVFSGNLWNDRNPSDIMLAESMDGLVWQITDSCVANDGHDPTLIQLDDGSWAMVYMLLKESLQVCLSESGLKWSAPQTITLLDENGQSVTEIHGDVALMRRPDGGLRLMSNDVAGISSFIPVSTGVIRNGNMPESFQILRLSPNPFNPSIRVEFQIESAGHIALNIVDIHGRMVASLAEGYYTAGIYRIPWHAANHAGGVYFIVLKSNLGIAAEKCILMK